MTILIFHSDDAGATKKVTRRIMQAWVDGLIASFSVLANGDSLGLVKQYLEQHPEKPARIAVHLNLCEGKSLAFNIGESTISDQDGLLNARFGSLLLNWLSFSAKRKKDLLSHIEAEWRTQIELIIETLSPRKIQALDGHMHMHMLPFLFPLAAKLAKEYGIPEIRVTNEVFHISQHASDSMSFSFLINIVKYVVLKLCSLPADKHLRHYKINAPDTIVGILYSGIMTAASAKKGIMAAKNKNRKCIEVLFHIGGSAPDESKRWDSCPDIGEFYWSQLRNSEYEELAKLRMEYFKEPFNHV